MLEMETRRQRYIMLTPTSERSENVKPEQAGQEVIPFNQPPHPPLQKLLWCSVMQTRARYIDAWLRKTAKNVHIKCRNSAISCCKSSPVASLSRPANVFFPFFLQTLKIPRVGVLDVRIRRATRSIRVG